MPRITNISAQKLIVTAVSAGALVAGGTGVAAFAAPDQPTEQPAVEQPDTAPAAEEPVEEPVAEEPVEEPVEEPAEDPVEEEPVAEDPVDEEPAEEEPAEQAGAEVPEGPSENASVVAQQAWAAAHVPAEDREPGSVSEVVLQYVPAGPKSESADAASAGAESAGAASAGAAHGPRGGR
ncbi:hypothetical protein [Sinomonas halotolerans]|uniref:Uncharacterized protein n=1 Tax=Sinomonas halotolerans TaxID=1644133 RepID=A0ABU9WZV7_9MICC